MKNKKIIFILTIIYSFVIVGCASLYNKKTTRSIPEIRPGILMGYLPVKELPDSLKLLPAPPSKNSPAFILDRIISSKAVSMQGSKRWQLAKSDADIMFPHAAHVFSCAMNIPITKKDTPHLYILLRRILADAGLSTYKAKKYYHRKRPFIFNQKPICTPEIKEKLEKNGAYPSGHAAVGWAWALILTEVLPEKANAILSRGWQFGQSRVICNVHWESDVIMGRVIGSAVVAKLHSNTAFLNDLKAAKEEVKQIISKGMISKDNCSFEASALKQYPQLAPWPANK